MDLLEPCPCDSGEIFANCCQPYIAGQSLPSTAEGLMRSRYTAYVLMDEKYLLATWHPATRPKRLTLNPVQRWLGLKVKSTLQGTEHNEEGEVTFAARYKIDGRGHRLEECSQFVREDGRWLYLRAR